MKKKSWIKIGSKCKWNDPAINDYDESDREDVLNTIWTIERIDGDIILLSSEDGGEAEVYACEIVPA